MPSRRVVVSQRNFDRVALDYLEANGCEVVMAKLPEGEADTNLSEEALIGTLKGAEGWILGHARVTRGLLESLPGLLVMSRRGVGYDRIDIEAAGELGRVVAIAAGGNNESVADHAIALMLGVKKRMWESQRRMVEGHFQILQGSDLFRSTVGIVGLGRIGRSLVQRLKGFEARVLVVAPREDAVFADAPGVTYTDMRTLLTESDVVTLHAPLSKDTDHLIDAAALEQMKPSAVIVNTARGGLIDDRALLEALKSGRIAGAGLDVFESERNAALGPVTAELVGLPNVVATPHTGASSREALVRTNMIAAESVVAVLDGDAPHPERLIVDGRRSPASKVARSPLVP